MPKVVLNADDLGLAESINLGIIQAHLKGLLKSVSVVACGGSVHHAFDLLRSTELDVGIHLTITQEKPLADPKLIPSIVDKNGNFFSMKEFLLRYLSGKIKLAHVYIEWKNQVEFLIKNGFGLIHMDGHQHLHILPGILKITKRIKSEYNFKFCRYERLEIISLFLTMPKKLPYFLTKLTSKINLGVKNLGSMHGFIGICFSGGRMQIELIGALFSKLKGIPFVELNFHPGFNNGDGSKKYSSWGYDWENDLRLLCDPKLYEKLDALDFEPAGFSDL